jgi:hypothetical protein
MGGDDSQKLLPWRGTSILSGAQQSSGARRNQHSNSNPELRVNGMNGMGTWLPFDGLELRLSRNYAACLEDPSDEPIDMVEVAVSGLA